MVVNCPYLTGTVLRPSLFHMGTPKTASWILISMVVGWFSFKLKFTDQMKIKKLDNGYNGYNTNKMKKKICLPNFFGVLGNSKIVT